MSAPLQLKTLLPLYFQGNCLEVVEKIFVRHQYFPILEGENPVFRAFLNYLHSLCFGALYDVVKTGHFLAKRALPEASPLIQVEQLLHVFALSSLEKVRKMAQQLQNCSEVDPLIEVILTLRLEEKCDLSNCLHQASQSRCMSAFSSQKFVRYFFHCQQFLRQRGEYIQSLQTPETHPIYPLSLETPLEEGALVFPSGAHLWHCLADVEGARRLCQPSQLLFVLDRPLQPQLQQQKELEWTGTYCAPFGACAGFESKIQKAYETPQSEPLLEEVLGWNSQNRRRLFGPSRYFAQCMQEFHQAWHDPARRLLSVSVPSLPFLVNRYSRKEARREFEGDGKVKIAHIVAQLVDGQHAPSSILDTLLQYTDRERFDPHVVIMESYVERPGEYPIPTHNSETTRERGGERLRRYQEEGICLVLEEPSGSYEDTVKKLSQILSALGIDIAVFHEGDVLHYTLANHCDVPFRVYYQHARSLSQPGFDLWVTVTPPTGALEKKCRDWGTRVATIPVPLKAPVLSESPLTAEDLGIPSACPLMTTISNHLNTRLTPEVRRVIAEILLRNPQVHYVPIGPCRSEELMKEFQEARVEDRVHFIGRMENPRRAMSLMTLYLNEFPVGSGLGLVDAMSEGVPIVSFYDPTGPEMGRAAGVFFGEERCIQSMDPKDYVEKACELLVNEPLHSDWRNYTQRRYEEITNPKKNVRLFEKALLSLLNNQFCRESIARGAVDF